MTDEGHAPTIPETKAPAHAGGPASQPRAPDDRYVLKSLLGKGGMGEIWLAHDVRIDREIAIKLMRGGHDSSDLVARFLREARVQGRLEHPSIVPVHDLGGDPAAPYFAMKRLAGTTLADVLASGDATRWPRRTLLARLIDVCLAVEFAHQRGVIHRDLKPANIMLGDFGEAYVLDWGLARIADADDSAPPVIRASDLRSDSGGSAQTVAGAMLGTPGYMAPEQMRGEPVDRRTDVFALGCLLFEILTGARAVPPEQAYELTLSVPCHRPAGRHPEADVPPELDDACARATAADPAQRLGSARELADLIQRFLDGDRDVARRRELAAQHTTAALVALGRGDAGRTEAMREAGRAIALDPTSRDAQTVLGRLLFEPPREIPAEAQQLIDLDRQRATQRMLRAGAIAYLGFLLLVPLIIVLGARQMTPLLVLGGMLVLLGVSAILLARRPKPIGPRMLNVVLLSHAVMLGTTGLVAGPLLLLPMFVTGSMATLILAPSVFAPARILAAMLIAVALPLASEWLGWTPRTYHTEGGTLTFKPWALDVPANAIVVVVLGAFLVQLFANAYVLMTQRRDQERLHERQHVQAWHWRQLL